MGKRPQTQDLYHITALTRALPRGNHPPSLKASRSSNCVHFQKLNGLVSGPQEFQYFGSIPTIAGASDASNRPQSEFPSLQVLKPMTLGPQDGFRAGVLPRSQTFQAEQLPRSTQEHHPQLSACRDCPCTSQQHHSSYPQGSLLAKKVGVDHWQCDTLSSWVELP